MGRTILEAVSDATSRDAKLRQEGQTALLVIGTFGINILVVEDVPLITAFFAIGFGLIWMLGLALNANDDARERRRLQNEIDLTLAEMRGQPVLDGPTKTKRSTSQLAGMMMRILAATNLTLVAGLYFPRLF